MIYGNFHFSVKLQDKASAWLGLDSMGEIVKIFVNISKHVNMYMYVKFKSIK